jgi:hypothetical protein
MGDLMAGQNTLVFPIGENTTSLYEGYGLSKRELFAAMAMQGLLNSSNDTFENIAHNSIMMADLLLTNLGVK